MATIIEQTPLHTTLPVGQEIIFAVSNNNVVANKTKVKFIAEVHISSINIPVLSSTNNLIGTFKTTPNNAGIGIFDLSTVVESYVTSDNLSRVGSKYKGTTLSSGEIQYPMHLIDTYSGNNNTARYLAIKFKIEYLNTSTNATVTQDPANSLNYTLFNGYLKYTDNLQVSNFSFGYNVGKFKLNNNTNSFLTNASTTQYANLNDYGTVAFLNPTDITSTGNVNYIKFTYKDSSGSSIGTENVLTTPTGLLPPVGNIGRSLIYFGCFPGNLQNWSSTFQALVAAGTMQGGYYDFSAYDVSDDRISQSYRININCDELKGYESIRLTWLNQWGVWDYYTFTQKSITSLSTKGSTYTQSKGTWNESYYKINGFKGGQKAFRVNATEKIVMNTDFITEAESEWFEDLINSPEVYILDGYQTDASLALLNTYVTPVKLTTSSYIRKTIANDKLMQYTFEVEKSKTLRTQAV